MPILGAGSIIPDAGTLVAVPMAAATGEPGAPVVAVMVKRWFTSPTLWTTIAGFGGAAADAIVNVLVPVLTSTDPVYWDKLWRPCILAVLMTYIAKRRVQQNSVVGSGT